MSLGKISGFIISKFHSLYAKKLSLYKVWRRREGSSSSSRASSSFKLSNSPPKKKEEDIQFSPSSTFQ